MVTNSRTQRVKLSFWDTNTNIPTRLDEQREIVLNKNKLKLRKRGWRTKKVREGDKIIETVTGKKIKPMREGDKEIKRQTIYNALRELDKR